LYKTKIAQHGVLVSISDLTVSVFGMRGIIYKMHCLVFFSVKDIQNSQVEIILIIPIIYEEFNSAIYFGYFDFSLDFILVAEFAYQDNISQKELFINNKLGIIE